MIEKNVNYPKLQTLFNDTRQWGVDRNFHTDATMEGQLDKLQEEVDELMDAVKENDLEEMIDAQGDILVTLINFNLVWGYQFDEPYSLEDCLAMAYNEIKDRKGKMINGKFVKEADLKKDDNL